MPTDVIVYPGLLVEGVKPTLMTASETRVGMEPLAL